MLIYLSLCLVLLNKIMLKQNFSKPYLSVIIPAFNEEKNLASGSLDKVLSYLSGQKYTWELILINDGSSDSTFQLLKKYSAHYPQLVIVDNPHQGKAASIITGALEAKGDYILFSDMDQATPISETAKILEKFSQGFEIVIGSRSGRKGAPLYRQILAYGMVLIRGLILRLPYKDTQCGFKAFSSNSAFKIFTIMKRVHPPHLITGPAVNPGFDVELLYIGRKMGFKISEIQVDWTHHASSRVRFLNDAINGVKELLLVRWRSLNNTYNLHSS